MMQLQPYDGFDFSPKKECKMSTTSTSTAISVTAELPGRREKDYLLSRLDSLTQTHTRSLKEHFNLNDLYPRTPFELMEFLKKGHYELSEKRIQRVRDNEYGYTKDEDLYWGEPLSYLVFRDPKKKRDKEGFEKAEELLLKAKQSTKDLIIIKSPDEGLAALQAFENQTFH